MRHSLALFALLLAAPVRADEPLLHFEHRAQLWLMSTFGARVDPTDSGALARVSPQADVFVRRGRLRFGASFPRDVELMVQLQYDGLAQNTGTLGDTGPTGPVDLQVRDAYATWGLVEDRLELKGGFFHPKYSREAEVSSFSVTSFEKSDLQSYLRQHVTGQSSGRVPGLQLDATVPLGGLELIATAGVFDPNAPGLAGEGLRWSPLLVGRLQLGQNGDAAYKPFERKSGFSLAAVGSWQPRTEVFRRNGSIGGDLTWRLGPFALVAEAHGLVREEATLTTDFVMLARVAWAFPLGEHVVQPVVTFTRYDGEADSHLAGEQTSVEAAVIAMLTPKLRVGLAFTWTDGTAPSLWSDGSSFQTAPWLALGLQHSM